eukprot:9478340-Pyramimonas_sp.AAC.1
MCIANTGITLPDYSLERTNKYGNTFTFIYNVPPSLTSTEDAADTRAITSRYITVGSHHHNRWITPSQLDWGWSAPVGQLNGHRLIEPIVKLHCKLIIVDWVSGEARGLGNGLSKR